MSRVAGQIDGATRRVPKVMALVLGEARNKVAARSGRNPIRLRSWLKQIDRCGLIFSAWARKSIISINVSPHLPLQIQNHRERTGPTARPCQV